MTDANIDHSEAPAENPLTGDFAGSPAAAAPGCPLLIRADGRRAAPGTLRVESYDFRNPVFLSEGELRRLRAGHEDFIRYLSARLSLFLRMEFGLKLNQLSTIAYAEFTESLGNPTHVCLFKAEPLAGVGILGMNPRLALAISDRLLGGRGQPAGAERDLTEIETALIEDVILMVLEEWCSQWKAAQEISANIIGRENGGRFLQTSPKDAAMLVLSMEADFGGCNEMIQIGVPFYTLEPLIQKMQSRRQRDASTQATQTGTATWKPAYDQIAMPLRAEWAALEISLRELTSLRVGDLIEMPASLINETQLLFNGTPKFTGSAGLDGDRVAVQISRKISSPDATLSLKSDGNKSA